MHADIPLIATIAAAFTLALALGFVTEKIGVPALVGYLLAGRVKKIAIPGAIFQMGIATALGVGWPLSGDGISALQLFLVSHYPAPVPLF